MDIALKLQRNIEVLHQKLKRYSAIESHAQNKKHEIMRILNMVGSKKDQELKIIENVVCYYFIITRETLILHTRKREIVVPRQLTMHFAWKYKVGSASYIGRFFGFDHATVFHSHKKINELLDCVNEHKLRSDYNNLDKTIKYKLRRDIPIDIAS